MKKRKMIHTNSKPRFRFKATAPQAYALFQQGEDSVSIARALKITEAQAMILLVRERERRRRDKNKPTFSAVHKSLVADGEG